MPDSPRPGLALKVPAQDQKLAVLRRRQVQVEFECMGAQLAAENRGMRWEDRFVSEIWSRESARIAVDDPDYKAIITVEHFDANERAEATAEAWPAGFDMVIRVMHNDCDPLSSPRVCANCGKVIRAVGG